MPESSKSHGESNQAKKVLKTDCVWDLKSQEFDLCNKEIWSSFLLNVDWRGSFQQARQNGDNIAGFSSSDDDDLTNPGLTAADKTSLSSVKR